MKKPIAAVPSLRTATREDGAFLLAVRNAPEVRARSKNQEIIPEAIHYAWLNARLHDPGAVIWILEHQGEREGYVRAQEIEARTWLLSIALQARFQRQGHGAWALREASRLLFEVRGACCLVAEVIAANSAARRLFEVAGFIPKSIEVQDGLDMARFTLYAETPRWLADHLTTKDD